MSEPGLSGVIEQIVIQSVNNVVRVRYIQKPRSRISANFGLFFRRAQAICPASSTTTSGFA